MRSTSSLAKLSLVSIMLLVAASGLAFNSLIPNAAVASPTTTTTTTNATATTNATTTLPLTPITPGIELGEDSFFSYE